MTSQSFTTTNYTNTESGSIKGTGHNTFTQAESHETSAIVSSDNFTKRTDANTFGPSVCPFGWFTSGNLSAHDYVCANSIKLGLEIAKFPLSGNWRFAAPGSSVADLYFETEEECHKYKQQIISKCPSGSIGMESLVPIDEDGFNAYLQSRSTSTYTVHEWFIARIPYFNTHGHVYLPVRVNVKFTNRIPTYEAVTEVEYDWEMLKGSFFVDCEQPHPLAPKPRVVACRARFCDEEGRVQTCCRKVDHCRYCTYCEYKINLDDEFCPNHPEICSTANDGFIDNEQFCEGCFDDYLEWKKATDFHQVWEFDRYESDGFDYHEATYGPIYVAMFKRRIPKETLGEFEYNTICCSEDKYYAADGEYKVKRDAYMFDPSLDPTKNDGEDTTTETVYDYQSDTDYDLNTGYESPSPKQCQAFGPVTEDGESLLHCTDTVTTYRYCFTCHKFVFEFIAEGQLCVECDSPTHLTNKYCMGCLSDYDMWCEAKKFHSEYKFDHEELAGYTWGDEPYMRPVYKIKVETPGKPVYTTPEGILYDSQYVWTEDGIKNHQANSNRWIGHTEYSTPLVDDKSDYDD